MNATAPLYVPPPEAAAASAMGRYLAAHGFADYDEAWRWSVRDLEAFWASVWEWFAVSSARPYDRVLARRSMPGAQWFPGARLNYVDQARRWPADRLALVARSEAGPPAEWSYGELFDQVARAAAGLRQLGVQAGDRVAGYLPNIPEAVVAFLASASLGAVWSACSPDFGAQAVLDRFRQIEPTVLIAADRYTFKGATIDRRDVVAQLTAGLPSLKATVVLPHTWPRAEPLEPTPRPFDHPLWILYSSGTTGPPKAIVHGHGGVLLEHLKAVALHCDVGGGAANIGGGDRFFWFTSTGWMMWNFLVGGLLTGATIVLYDGSPAYPDMGALWRLAGETGVTYFGTSAPYLQACAKAGVEPAAVADVSRLRAVGSTGAPLPPEGFHWVYDHVKADLALGSVSGGTDLCTAFVGSSPTLPVHAGELQCRCLGAKVEAWDAGGAARIGEVGELVITEPMPSMPLRFWDDEGDERYRASYFATYPGVWRHGDWIRITDRGTAIIYGRSDATLNRGGVRMGTSEFYRVVESLPEVADSLVVDTGWLGQEGRLRLFVVLSGGAALDERLRATIVARLRADLSPRHVPDAIVAVAEIPRTLNGKKLEVPVRRILLGEPPESVVGSEAVANPGALATFVGMLD